MADDDVKSGLKNLENFQLSNSYQLFSTSHQQKILLKECPMVVIRDSLSHDDYSIFPPSNHENLHPPSNPKREGKNPVSSSSTTSFRSSSSSSSSSFSSFSFSDDETSQSPSSPMSSKYQVRRSREGEASWWMLFGVQILRSRIMATASTIWSKTAIWLSSPTARIGLVLTLWWLYKRARRRRLRQNSDQLRMIIKDKDEKISQLLHQIAQLNGVLIAQKKVPSN